MYGEVKRPNQSFLSNLIGWNTYDEFKSYAPKIVLVYSCVLLVLFLLTLCCHWSWVSSLFSIATGYSLVFIAYLIEIILLLDREVKMDIEDEHSWNGPTYKKPKTYTFTVIWAILLCVMAIAAAYFTNRYKKAYGFECSTVLYEEDTNTYHYFDDCENISGDIQEVHGYEIDSNEAEPCDYCLEIIEDNDEQMGRLHPD